MTNKIGNIGRQDRLDQYIQEMNESNLQYRNKKKSNSFR